MLRNHPVNHAIGELLNSITTVRRRIVEDHDVEVTPPKATLLSPSHRRAQRSRLPSNVGYQLDDVTGSETAPTSAWDRAARLERWWSGIVFCEPSMYGTIDDSDSKLGSRHAHDTECDDGIDEDLRNGRSHNFARSG